MKTAESIGALELGSGRPIYLTIGNFDGVHRGHAAIFSELTATAARAGAASVAATFEPHPLEVVAPERSPKLLTLPHEKLRLIDEAGVDALVVVPFTPEVAGCDAGRFLGRLGVDMVEHVVLGYDFRMGRDRACGVDRLGELGREFGFSLDVVAAVEHDGEPVSSTRIRESLERGDVAGAARMLGRPYELSGRIVAGRGRGRALGAATANLDVPPRKLLPADGVYLARAASSDGPPGGLDGRAAVVYVGRRPTYPGRERAVEAHLLDFEGDLLGATLRLRVLIRRRGDERLPDEEALRRRIAEDIAWARETWAAERGSDQGRDSV